MPGLVWSWSHFDWCLVCNVQATQLLLEVIRRSNTRLRRLIYSSTSSVYGRFSSGDEKLPTQPVSSFGVTKLAAENL
jgi:nucleoside-diphosphate-sugar epimerase